MKSFKQYLFPSIIAQVFMSAYILIDGLFIGLKMSDIGLAAINLGWPITSFLQAIGTAIGISSGIYLTRLKAKGEEKRIACVKGTILVLLLVISICLGFILYLLRESILIAFQAKGETLTAAMEYVSIILYGSMFQLFGCAMIPLLKNDSHIKIAMVASLSATIVNFILDYLMIFLWNLGLRGAALASIISQGVAVIICIIPYAKGIKGFLLDIEAIKELFLGSIAPFVLGYSYSVLIIITNALCELYSGDGAVAAYTLLSYLLYIVNALAQGTSDAIQPLFSYHAEKKEYKINYTYLYRCLGISFTIVFLFSLFAYIFRDSLSNLYGLSEKAKPIFQEALVLYFIGFLFVSVSKVICSYLYSINRKILANLLVIIEPIVLTPMFYLILMNLKTLGLWIGFMIVQIILSILSIVFYIYSRREKHEWFSHHRQAKGDDISNRLS